MNISKKKKKLICLQLKWNSISIVNKSIFFLFRQFFFFVLFFKWICNYNFECYHDEQCKSIVEESLLMIQDITWKMKLLKQSKILTIFTLQSSLLSLCVFHTSTDWASSVKSKWQQVISVLQDSSQYSSWAQLCWCLHTFNLSVNLQFSQAVFQHLWDCSKTPTIIGITVIFMFNNLFSSLARSWYFSIFYFIHSVKADVALFFHTIFW